MVHHNNQMPEDGQLFMWMSVEQNPLIDWPMAKYYISHFRAPEHTWRVCDAGGWFSFNEKDLMNLLEKEVIVAYYP
jgi:hypothetical protein